MGGLASRLTGPALGCRRGVDEDDLQIDVARCRTGSQQRQPAPAVGQTRRELGVDRPGPDVKGLHAPSSIEVEPDIDVDLVGPRGATRLGCLGGRGQHVVEAAVAPRGVLQYRRHVAANVPAELDRRAGILGTGRARILGTILRSWRGDGHRGSRSRGPCGAAR